MANSLYKTENLKVLIVDDQDPIRKAVKRVLISMGFKDVIECFDGEDAIEYLQNKQADLVICDLLMRKVSGFEVIQFIRNQNMGNDIPIIVVTGEGSRDEIVKAADYGTNDYMVKPFQADDFEKKVESVLEKYHSPSPLVATLRLAERHFLDGQLDISERAFEEALKLDSESARATFGISAIMVKKGDIDGAVKLMEQSTKTNQSYYKSFAALANLYLKMGRTTDAVDAMETELEINPKQPRRQTQIAALFMKEGNPEKAIEHYREALRESPNIKSALLGMGVAFSKIENLDKAFYYLKRVRRYHPTTTKALEHAVKIALDADEEKRAELFLRDEKNTRPDQLDTYIVLAKLYAHQGRFEDGISTLDELLAKEPEQSQALKIKGTLFYNLKDYRKCIEILDRAIKLDADQHTLITLSNAKIAVGELNGALEALTKSLVDTNSNPQILVQIAQLYQKTEQFTKAYIAFRRAAVLGADKAMCKQQAKISKAGLQGRRSPRQAS